MVVETAICFAGGSSGHFVLHICSNILYNTEIEINSDGSCHAKTNIPDCIFVANEYALDSDSHKAEENFLNNIPNCKFLLGHMRNINLVASMSKRVIYIDFTNDDIKVLHDNIKHKAAHISPKAYEILRGADWPEYTDKLPLHIVNEINELNDKHYTEWNWLLPASASNVLKINFKDISNETWIEDLFGFLNVKPTIEKINYLQRKLKEYKDAQSLHRDAISA